MKLHIRLFLFFGLSLSLLAKGKDEEAVDFMEIVGNVEGIDCGPGRQG